jgi:hypothetical protein
MDVRINGFSVKVAQSLRDPATEDLALFNIYGPLQSVRAVWAGLKSRKQYHWEFGGTVKLNKSPGHILLKTDTPNGWANWTFISRQAIPKLLDPSLPTYCWTQTYNPHNQKPPESAYPVLMATLPFPMLEEWTDYLWNSGRDRRVIIELRKPTGVMGYKILPNRTVWEEIIKNGFSSQQIYIDKPAPPKPVKPIKQGEAINIVSGEIINIYSRKEAIADEQQYDANIEPFQDVTEQHYKWPVYMSREVYWLMKESVEGEGSWTDFKGIWHDILTLSNSHYQEISQTQRKFGVVIRDKHGLQTIFEFESETGAFDYDDPSPCVYVKLSSEDD